MKFQVRIPEAYSHAIPEIIRSGNMPPIRREDNSMALSMVTAATIIDMIINHVEFYITSDEATIRLVEICLDYQQAMDQLDSVCNTHEDVFLRRLSDALTVLMPIYNNLVNRKNAKDSVGKQKFVPLSVLLKNAVQ